MAKLNMANMNTLFRKVYLLAGVIMAANMFAVNEVKAMNSPEDKKDGLMATEGKEQNFGEEGKEKKKNNNNKKNFFTQDGTKKTTIKILFLENYVNFFGTLALSGFNNYLKWWDYNQGTYCKFVWFGWRSKKLLNDMFQFDINLNLVRGILWLLPGYLFFFVQRGYSNIYIRTTACSFTISLLFFLVRNNKTERLEVTNQSLMKVIAFLLSILQGFISAPLTFHISNFSISISLDAILWELVAIWARKKVEGIHDENL